MISRFFLCFESMRRVRVGGNNENGPKRHKACRLGPKYVLFLFFSSCFSKLIFSWGFFHIKDPLPVQYHHRTPPSLET